MLTTKTRTEFPLPQHDKAGEANEEQNSGDHGLPLACALTHLSKAVLEADTVHCNKQNKSLGICINNILSHPLHHMGSTRSSLIIIINIIIIS